MKKDIIVYHIDKRYGANNEIRYSVMPYSLKGTFLIYFGINLKDRCWRILFHPWYSRITSFVKWFTMTRFSQKRAENLANKMMSDYNDK